MNISSPPDKSALRRLGRGGSTTMLLLLALLSVLTLQAQQEEAPDLSDIKERGRACTKWFYAKEFDEIRELGLTPELESAMQDVGDFEGFWDIVQAQLGSEVEVLEETTTAQGYEVYQRTARFEKFGGEIWVQWAFDDAGAIAGFFIRPKQ